MAEIIKLLERIAAALEESNQLRRIGMRARGELSTAGTRERESFPRP